jgi:hypothetical protein
MSPSAYFGNRFGRIKSLRIYVIKVIGASIAVLKNGLKKK